MITLLTGPESLVREEILVEGPAYRHLFKTRRLELGARVRVVDGQGGAHWARVERVERTQASLSLIEPAPPNEPAIEVVVLVAPPKPARAVWLVEKATEVGAAAIRFVNSERSPRSYGETNFQRLRRVAAAAVEQTHRARIPDVSGMHLWSEMRALLEPCRDRLCLDPAGAGDPALSQGPVALVVGPEGGWSEPERAELADWGCQPWNLGPRILRVETAAVVGCAVLLQSLK